MKLWFVCMCLLSQVTRGRWKVAWINGIYHGKTWQSSILSCVSGVCRSLFLDLHFVLVLLLPPFRFYCWFCNRSYKEAKWNLTDQWVVQREVEVKPLQSSSLGFIRSGNWIHRTHWLCLMSILRIAVTGYVGGRLTLGSGGRKVRNTTSVPFIIRRTKKVCHILRKQ